MRSLSKVLFYSSPLIRSMTPCGAGVPKSRAEAIEPKDDGSFILPLQQAFIKNPRIMASTARLIALLSGWAGHGGAISTTQGVLAKHMGKSVRQIQRMLQDAVNEGYLLYSYTKSRIGMITGITIYLRFSRIRKQKPQKKRKNLATTKESSINRNSFNYKKDKELEERLQRLSQSMGLNYSPG